VRVHVGQADQLKEPCRMGVNVSPLPYPKEWAAFFFSLLRRAYERGNQEKKKRWRKGSDERRKEPRVVYNGANKRERRKDVQSTKYAPYNKGLKSEICRYLWTRFTAWVEVILPTGWMRRAGA
jgi:SLT domain-containing protein